MRLLLFIVAGCALTQELERPLFKTAVANVRVDTQVQQRNRFVDNLIQEDFRASRATGPDCAASPASMGLWRSVWPRGQNVGT